MSDLDLGWAWFETNSSLGELEKSPPDHELASVFARCFRGEDGVKVLKHLQKITHHRILGPAASDALLRHMEGQRQLVAHMTSLVEHGRTHGHTGDLSPKQYGSVKTENTYG